MNSRIDVALILWNPDVIELMSIVLLRRDLRSGGVEPAGGRENISKFIASCAATVIILDLAPPYNRSAEEALCILDRFPDRSFIMTCADRGLALSTAPWLHQFPVYQKPYPLDAIADEARAMVIGASRRMVTVPLYD